MPELPLKHIPGLEDEFLLDTGSSVPGMICNPNLVTDIKVSKNPMLMETNGGPKFMNLEAMLPGFGKTEAEQKVCFDTGLLANILGFSALIDRGYQIKYDSDMDDAFNVVNLEGNVLKFSRNSEGLYTYKPSKKYLDFIAECKGMAPLAPSADPRSDTLVQNMISTIEGNQKGFTKHES